MEPIRGDCLNLITQKYESHTFDKLCHKKQNNDSLIHLMDIFNDYPELKLEEDLPSDQERVLIISEENLEDETSKVELNNAETYLMYRWHSDGLKQVKGEDNQYYQKNFYVCAEKKSKSCPAKRTVHYLPGKEEFDFKNNHNHNYMPTKKNKVLLVDKYENEMKIHKDISITQPSNVDLVPISTKYFQLQGKVDMIQMKSCKYHKKTISPLPVIQFIDPSISSSKHFYNPNAVEIKIFLLPSFKSSDCTEFLELMDTEVQLAKPMKLIIRDKNKQRIAPNLNYYLKFQITWKVNEKTIVEQLCTEPFILLSQISYYQARKQIQ